MVTAAGGGNIWVYGTGGIIEAESSIENRKEQDQGPSC